MMEQDETGGFSFLVAFCNPIGCAQLIDEYPEAASFLVFFESSTSGRPPVPL
jgi:hypothetical protein